MLPGDAGIAGAVLGLGAEDSLFVFGSLPNILPPGSLWQLQPEGFDYDNATLGFLLGAYGYDRLKPRRKQPARLRLEDLSPRVIATAESICFARDLINTPPNLLGPEQLGDAAFRLADEFGATIERVNDAALQKRFPRIARRWRGFGPSARGNNFLLAREECGSIRTPYFAMRKRRLF